MMNLHPYIHIVHSYKTNTNTSNFKAAKQKNIHRSLVRNIVIIIYHAMDTFEARNLLLLPKKYIVALKWAITVNWKFKQWCVTDLGSSGSDFVATTIRRNPSILNFWTQYPIYSHGVSWPTKFISDLTRFMYSHFQVLIIGSLSGE